MSKAYWSKPHRWNNEDPYTDQYRARVFPSLCDWLDDEVPIEWLADFLKLIHDTPNLDWLLLTKRPENWNFRMHWANGHWARKIKLEDFESPEAKTCFWITDWIQGKVPQNVWIGVSVEDQKRADERIPELLKIPAKLRFLSVEPMLGPVNLSGNSTHEVWPWAEAIAKGEGFTWCIFGGESGPGARPCHTDWIRDGVRQCRAVGCAPFVKQLGANVLSSGMSGPGEHWPLGSTLMDTCKGHFQKRLIDKKGGDINEWPEDLRIRKFPIV